MAGAKTQSVCQCCQSQLWLQQGLENAMPRTEQPPAGHWSAHGCTSAGWGTLGEEPAAATTAAATNCPPQGLTMISHQSAANA